MFERFTRKSLAATGAALLAALGVGGAALAQGNSQAPAKTPASQQSVETPGQESNAPENSATDTDNVQEGDQNEPAGTEKESGTEQPGDDGPGGHADEPGNPDADHQFEGEE